MKFHAIYTPTIMSGAVVRYQSGYERGTRRDMFTGEERIEYSAEISASRDGVMIQGAWPMITQQSDIEDLATMLQRAFSAHRRIKVGEHDAAKQIVEEFEKEHAAVEVDTAAEAALLGAILANNQAFHRVVHFLRTEHFSDGAHCLIFEGCKALIEFGTVVNPITLRDYLDGVGHLESVGGTPYLARIAGAVVTTDNAVVYAQRLRDLYLKRTAKVPA